MSLTDALQILFWTAFGIFAGWWIFFGYWRLRSEIRRRAEGEAPLRSSRQLIWRDPGSISADRLEAGPAAAQRYSLDGYAGRLTEIYQELAMSGTSRATISTSALQPQ